MVVRGGASLALARLFAFVRACLAFLCAVIGHTAGVFVTSVDAVRHFFFPCSDASSSGAPTIRGSNTRRLPPPTIPFMSAVTARGCPNLTRLSVRRASMYAEVTYSVRVLIRVRVSCLFGLCVSVFVQQCRVQVVQSVFCWVLRVRQICQQEEQRSRWREGNRESVGGAVSSGSYIRVGRRSVAGEEKER